MTHHFLPPIFGIDPHVPEAYYKIFDTLLQLFTLVRATHTKQQWRDRRWIGTALADRFGPRLDCTSSTVVSVAAAVAHHKRISSSSSPQLTRTTTTCQVSRNRHHPPAPADRRTRAPPSPRLSPRRRRRQRAGQSGLAPWPTIRTTGPSTHRRPRRVSPSPCLLLGGIFTEIRKKNRISVPGLYVVHLSQGISMPPELSSYRPTARN